MEEFKKELATLLQKYPDLPEFHLTIRPRIVIEETKQKVVVPQFVIPPQPTNTVTLPYKPEYQDLEAGVSERIKKLGLKEIVQS